MTVTTNASELAATFRKYLQYNQRDRIELLKKQALQLVIGSKGHPGLFQYTKEGAPTPAKIASDVARQGWKIPAYFPDGRIGRGHPSDWAGAAVPKRGRGRPSKKSLANADAIKSAKPTLEQMQKYVIKRRVDAILYVASGWLGAAQDLGGSLALSSGSVKSVRGRAETNVGAGGVSITLVNNTPGILYVNDKYQVAKRAIAQRVADMNEYILRKQQEAAVATGLQKAA